MATRKPPLCALPATIDVAGGTTPPVETSNKPNYGTPPAPMDMEPDRRENGLPEPPEGKVPC